MNLSKHKKICLHCGEPFYPDLRNRARQEYCYRPACRKARKNQSHRVWRTRNPDYFKGQVNVDRVRQWRARKPDYWRRPNSAAHASQRGLAPAPHEHSPLQDRVPPLQDSIDWKSLILGLVARLCGCTLQDCVEKVIPELIIKGVEIPPLMDQGRTINPKLATHDPPDTSSSREPRPPGLAGPHWPSCGSPE